VKLAPSTSTRRYFGQILDVHTVTISGLNGANVANGPVTLELLTGYGGGAFPPATMTGKNTMTFTFNGGVKAAGFVVSARSDVSIHDATVTQEAPDSNGFRLDTTFSIGALNVMVAPQSHGGFLFRAYRDPREARRLARQSGRCESHHIH